MNPYESPRETGVHQKFAWRRVLLLPAVLFFALAGYQVFKCFEVIELARGALRPLPPTMYREHPMLAVAFGALGVACSVAAFRKGKPEQN